MIELKLITSREREVEYRDEKLIEKRMDYIIEFEGNAIYNVIKNTSDYGEFQIKQVYVAPADRNNYFPDIYFEEPNKHNGLEKETYKIQTTAYGAMDVNEIDKVIEGYQIAKETVALLKENL